MRGSLATTQKPYAISKLSICFSKTILTVCFGVYSIATSNSTDIESQFIKHFRNRTEDGSRLEPTVRPVGSTVPRGSVRTVNNASSIALYTISDLLYTVSKKSTRLNLIHHSESSVIISNIFHEYII